MVDESLRLRVARALAEDAGSKAFREPGTEWDHFRSLWLRKADVAISAINVSIASSGLYERLKDQ